MIKYLFLITIILMNKSIMWLFKEIIKDLQQEEFNNLIEVIK